MAKIHDIPVLKSYTDFYLKELVVSKHGIKRVWLLLYSVLRNILLLQVPDFLVTVCETKLRLKLATCCCANIHTDTLKWKCNPNMAREK